MALARLADHHPGQPAAVSDQKHERLLPEANTGEWVTRRKLPAAVRGVEEARPATKNALGLGPELIRW